MSDDLFREPVLVGETEVMKELSGREDKPAYVTDEADLLHDINEKLAVLLEKADAHTNAVNQFGGMLDHIVQTVSQFGKMVSQGGMSGLLGMLGGKSE